MSERRSVRKRVSESLPVIDGMTGARESFAITSAEADAVAAGEADLAMRDTHVFAIAHADAAAVEGADLGDDTLLDEAVLCSLKGDGAAMCTGEREAANGDVLRAFDFEKGFGDGDRDRW